MPPLHRFVSMSSCGGFYGAVTRTHVTPIGNRINERVRVDDDEVTPSRKNRTAVDQKLDKVLDGLKSQQDENAKFREALTELNDKVSELQVKSSLANAWNSGCCIPPGLSVSSFFSATAIQFYCYR